jgi:deoxyadenosine/deoxycytidine kinase
LESEAWFLAESVATHRAIERDGRRGLQERSALEHIGVFAQARHRFGWLDGEELGLLQMLARLLTEGLEPPDLLIYMEADAATLQTRIAERARPGEQALDPAYLAALAELYDEFVDGWRLSAVYRLDTARVDIREQDSFAIACRAIEGMLR